MREVMQDPGKWFLFCVFLTFIYGVVYNCVAWVMKRWGFR